MRIRYFYKCKFDPLHPGDSSVFENDKVGISALETEIKRWLVLFFLFAILEKVVENAHRQSQFRTSADSDTHEAETSQHAANKKPVHPPQLRFLYLLSVCNLTVE
jgi:hypothetical protein